MLILTTTKSKRAMFSSVSLDQFNVLVSHFLDFNMADLHKAYITIPEEYEGDPNDLHLHDMQAAIDQSMQAQYYAVEDENGASSSNLSIPVPSSTSYRHHTPAIGEWYLGRSYCGTY